MATILVIRTKNTPRRETSKINSAKASLFSNKEFNPSLTDQFIPLNILFALTT